MTITRGDHFPANAASISVKLMMVSRSPTPPQVRCGTIQDDRSRSRLAGDQVGLEPFSVGEIAAENPLIWQESHLIHQVNGDR